MSTSVMRMRGPSEAQNGQLDRGKLVSADSIRRRLHELGVDVADIETNGHTVKLPLTELNRILELLERAKP